MTPTLTRVLKPGAYGKDVQGVRRACRKFTGQEPPSASLAVQRTFNASMTVLVKAAQDGAVLPKSGLVGPKLMAALRRADAFDAYATQLLDQYATEHAAYVLPALGPVYAGGRSVLDHDLTHATSGIPLYPAFDDAFTEDLEIIAPENVRVHKQLTSSRPGHAFYAIGDSGIQYWFGHLDRSHPLGVEFEKGAVVGRVAPNTVGGGPHVHVGVNVELLLGKGEELEHRTGYQHGAPTVGEQLRAALGG